MTDSFKCKGSKGIIVTDILRYIFVMRHENLKLFALEIVPKYLLLTRGRPVSLARNLVPSWSVQVVNRYFIIK